MRKLVTTLFGAALCLTLASSAFAANAVRISQVYGGGGGSTGNYLYDYIELFNNSGVAVSLNGWSIQYGSATGTSFGSAAGNMAIFPANASIPACGYYLIQCGTVGTAGGSPSATPDLIAAGPSMSATTGKVALVNVVTLNTLCSNSGAFIDRVGYGPTANCFETTATGVLTSTFTAVRKLAGIQDTDDNSADFDILATNTVTLHNSSSTNTSCLATPTTPRTWGSVKMIYR